MAKLTIPLHGYTGLTFDIDQAIHSFKYGYKIFEASDFSLFVTSGFRYYDQEMRCVNINTNFDVGVDGAVCVWRALIGMVGVVVRV